MTKLLLLLLGLVLLAQGQRQGQGQGQRISVQGQEENDREQGFRYILYQHLGVSRASKSCRRQRKKYLDSV